MDIKLLDCTLRDGGYYNSWDFPIELVRDYLKAVNIAKIEYVELGLRQFPADKYLGAHAFTTRHYLDELELPAGPAYGVMVDARTLLKNGEKESKCLTEKLFMPSHQESFSLVRVAAHIDEVGQCGLLVKCLHDLGYQVAVNVMQASTREEAELRKSAETLAHYGCVDVLYIADSLGSMEKVDIKRVFSAVKDVWEGPLGFHAHDNRGRALANTEIALNEGATWLDCTVSGMGRGAGNARSEILAMDIPNIHGERDYAGLLALSEGPFSTMKTRYGWGHTPSFHYAAKLDIHPTYIQNLVADDSINKKYLFKIIDYVGNHKNKKRYCSETLHLAKHAISDHLRSDTPQGSTVPPVFSEKEVLLVAQTTQTKAYESAIKIYIEQRGPVAIAINIPDEECEIPYDYFAVSHNEKFIEQKQLYKSLEKKIIAPASQLFEGGLDVFCDYGISIKEAEFAPLPCYAILPSRLTFAYAVAFSIAAGASRIHLVGFEGHDVADKRSKEMLLCLRVMEQCGIELISLTPTHLPIQEGSIYAV